MGQDNPGIDGIDGKPGHQGVKGDVGPIGPAGPKGQDYDKTKTLWCADGSLCKTPNATNNSGAYYFA